MNTRSIGVCGLLIMTLLAARTYAIDIHIAPFVFIDDSKEPTNAAPNVDGDLYALLAARQFEGRVAFKRNNDVDGERAPAPRSLLEALRLSDAERYEYLLYGYVRKTDDTMVVELRLADRDARNVAAVFFGGDTPDQYERLLGDLDAKIDGYLRAMFGLNPELGPEQVRRFVWSIPVSAGYWLSASSGWSEELAGVAYGKLGVRLWPQVPAYVKASHPRQIGGGLDFEYFYGTNAPGREEASLHSAIGRIAFDYAIDFNNRHRIGLSAGPFIRVDFLTQSRLYDDEVSKRSTASGFGVELRYGVLLGERWELGTGLAADATFYSDVLVTISPRIGFSYRFIPKEKIPHDR